MLIFNTTNETQSVKALGNWFTFKAKQIKDIRDEIGAFISEMRQENGLVALPEEFSDLEYRNSPEGKAKFEAVEQQGINAYVNKLRGLIYNNQVSLRRDLKQKDMAIDPAAEASQGELDAMRLVASYQRSRNDKDQAKTDEVKRLIKEIGPLDK